MTAELCHAQPDLAQLLRQKRYQQALEAADQLDQSARDTLEISIQLELRYARNMVALSRRRPGIYAALMKLDPSDRYQLVEAKPHANQRLLTIADTISAGNPLILSPNHDPTGTVRDIMAQLKPNYDSGIGLIFTGIGDGYLLNIVAHHPPDLFMDKQQTITIIEPDLALLRVVLMIHNYSGVEGPIEQARMRWYVGPEWEQQLHADALSNQRLGQRSMVLKVGRDSESMSLVVSAALEAIEQQSKDHQNTIDRYYAELPSDELASVFIDDPETRSRQPRVLFLTSRFTTVLQYAARDTARAFEQLGWQTVVHKESSRDHVVTIPELRSLLATFKPDLVFLLDHLRRETARLFPPNLPVVSWFQDHLPNLCNPQAGQSIGLRDYILTWAAPLFTDRYCYPARQCIDIPMMLTHPPQRPEQWQNDGDDLVYVSNVSGEPARLIDDIRSNCPPEARATFDQAAATIIKCYAEGDSLPTHYHIQQLIDESQSATLSHEIREWLLSKFWNPINIALYRQQALHWIADAADAMGRTLAIYGQGWENHPRFAPYARGVIQHGPKLEKLTRATRINLNLEPYACFTHHRLLDGVTAGGFFIVRDHPTHQWLPRITRFLDTHFVGRHDQVQSMHDARRLIDPVHRDELEQIISQAACLSFADDADPIRQTRCWQRSDAAPPEPGDSVLPRLDEISFTDKNSCQALLERYLDDAESRRAITEVQRLAVEQRLTFTANMRRITRHIGRLIQHENTSPVQAAG